MAARRKIAFPKRGQVYLVSFDPTVGKEIRKTRPAVILQNDTANRWSLITIVAAVTSQFEEPLYPTEVRVKASEGGFRGAFEPDPVNRQTAPRETPRGVEAGYNGPG